MKKHIKILATLSTAAIILAGCGSSDSSSGNVETTKVVDDIPSGVMLNYVKAIDENSTFAFGYKAVRLVYTTKTPDGKEVEASGILVIPEAPDAIKAAFGGVYPISVVVDNHGTIFKDSEAPSNTEVSDGAPNLKTAILFTGKAGFATVMPDYLGYGASRGITHPYIMKYSAQASIDMLNAAEKYLRDNNYTVTNDVYITGYSEGGYVAMEMAKEMQENNTTYHIAAAAPMAGPYDVEQLGIEDLNDSKPMVFPAFLAFLADSYSKYYNQDISKIVVKPEVFTNYDLFGGDYNFTAIHYYLGLTNLSKGDLGLYIPELNMTGHYPHELFRSDFISNFESNPSNPLREELKENSNYAWVPQFPVNIVNCVDDEIIPYSIAYEANATMNALGAPAVTLTPIPSSYIAPFSQDEPFVHQRCAPVAYGVAAQFFDGVRKQILAAQQNSTSN
jgi:pimeloyl-ACP methyl ester carboxylesterase